MTELYEKIAIALFNNYWQPIPSSKLLMIPPPWITGYLGATAKHKIVAGSVQFNGGRLSILPGMDKPRIQ